VVFYFIHLNDYSYKNILKVSVPLIFGGIAQTLINVTDSIFLGHVSTIALGACAISGLFYVTFFMLGLGFSIGSQIMVAKLVGEKKYSQVGKIIDHTVYFLSAFAVVIFIILFFFSNFLLSFFVQSKEILAASISFIKYRSFGIFCGFFILVVRAFFTGISQTKVVFYTTAITAGANVIFNYLLVFGNFGFARMEIEGSALASTLSELLAAIFALVYILNSSARLKYSVFKFLKPKTKILKELFNLSAPLMLQVYISLCSWFAFFLIIEKIGSRELALSNLVRNVYMILMIPLMGFSSATNTLVSKLIGQGKKDFIFTVINRIIKLSLLFSFILVVVNFFFVEYILGVFTNDKLLIMQTIPSIYVISGSMMVFSVVYIYLSAVSGSGFTKESLYIEILTLIFYLFATWLAAIYLKLSIEWVWSVEYVYFAAMGTMSLLFLKSKYSSK
jgi:putative MATE family efflux protein